MVIRRQHGFTLLEIIIVMVSVALILLMVFLAIFGTQRSRRDHQRKRDLAKVMSSIDLWSSNHNGKVPTHTEFSGNHKTAQDSDPGTVAYDYMRGIEDPMTSESYVYGWQDTDIGSDNQEDIPSCTPNNIAEPDDNRPTSASNASAGVSYQKFSNGKYYVRICLEVEEYNRYSD